MKCTPESQPVGSEVDNEKENARTNGEDEVNTERHQLLGSATAISSVQDSGKRATARRMNLSKAQIAGAVVGAAVEVIPNVIKAPDLYKKLSNPSDERNVFEPAIHIVQNQTAAVQTRIKKGDPDAHAWDGDYRLQQRLSSYSPAVLTIDGLTSSNNVTDPHEIWFALPCRPQKIGRNEFYAVAGDMPSYVQIFTDLQNHSRLPKIGRNDQPNYINTILNLHKEDNNTQSNLSFRAQQGIDLAKIISGLIAIYLTKKSTVGQKQEPTLSRRTILKGLGLAALGGGLSSSGVLSFTEYQTNRLATNASTEGQNEFWQQLTSYIDNTPEDIWLDGRTALLIAKNEDAANYLRQEKIIPNEARSAVILGNGHGFKGNLLMCDIDARNAAILVYGQLVKDITTHFVAAPLGVPEYQRGELVNRVLDYLSDIKISCVSDPGIPPGTTLKDYVETNVKPFTSIKSLQVEHAIKSLRQTSP